MRNRNVNGPIELPQNRWVRRSGRLSLAICLFLVTFFSLANAGITKYVPFLGAIGVSVIGMYAATLLRERADRLDLNGMFAGQTVIRCAVALPLLLTVAFAILLGIQLS